MTNEVLVQLGILVVSVIAILVGLLKLSREVRHRNKASRKEFEWRMRQAAISYSLTKNPDMRDIRTQIDKYFGITKRFDEMPRIPLTQKELQHAFEDAELYNNIVFFMAHWENMAMAIAFNYAHEEVAFEMTANWVVLYTELFKNFIIKRRQVNPRAYQYLLTLVKKWAEQLESNPHRRSDLRESE